MRNILKSDKIRFIFRLLKEKKAKKITNLYILWRKNVLKNSFSINIYNHSLTKFEKNYNNLDVFKNFLIETLDWGIVNENVYFWFDSHLYLCLTLEKYYERIV